MFSLQLIHDLAHGKYVDSPRDAKQLARFAAAEKEFAFLWATGNGISEGRLEHPARDGREFRDFTRRTLDNFAYLQSYDVRELSITEDLEPRIRAAQKIWNFEFDIWECRAQIAAARKRARDEERQLREEMQSGERYRKYRKWAKEGDAEAAAFFESVGWPVTEPAE